MAAHYISSPNPRCTFNNFQGNLEILQLENSEPRDSRWHYELTYLSQGGRCIRLDGNVGYDLFAVSQNKLPPKSTTQIDLQMRINFPPGVYGKIEGRSSLAKKSVFPLGGIIDSSYRGSIIVILRNENNHFVTLPKNKAICQLVLHQEILPNVIHPDISNFVTIDTARGEGQGGSTDHVMEQLQNLFM